MRYKIIFSYNGKGYCGWQMQKNKPTIQAELNEVLSQVLNMSINVTASGRTDTDVSAIEQVGHFDFDGIMPKNVVGYVNSLLTSNISVSSITEQNGFHARYDAKEKTYSYKFYIAPVKNAVFDQFAYHVKGNVNVENMLASIKYLVGEHDFSAFCATNTQVVDKVRTIYNSELRRDGNLFTFTITGNGFLYNMVRIIVGTIIMIGLKGESPSIMKKIILSKDRTKAGKTVPAYPLVLRNVKYNN